MKKYSFKEDRIVAFIYIEGEFFTHKFHTECITNYLKSKKMINKDEELYLMLNNNSSIARKWIDKIEDNCIFGEMSNYNNEIVVIIFDELTELGKSVLKKKCLERFGITKVLQAKYIGEKYNKFTFTEL